MNRTIPSLVFFAALIATPISVLANTIDASLIPDGTYTVKVEKIVDAKHILVTMDNGAESTLSAGRDSVDFTKIKPEDQVKLSLITGKVMVYIDLGH